ncbi:MAG: right-handed parallel beta-helix repeat-containing protein [Deltaproteobacteria bacterium]|nr:right-handed parallel beta-helix repeat-containing protein [Deltaproteobacteria bacterium]
MKKKIYVPKIYCLFLYIAITIVFFASLTEASSCDNLDIDNYLEDNMFTIEDGIGLIGHIKTINSAGNTVLQQILIGTSTPNGSIEVISGNLNELLGSIALASKVGLALTKHEYSNAAWIAAKYGIKKYINSTLLGNVISAPIALAEVAALPIKLTLDHLQSELAKTAFNNQLKMYKRARESGLTHEDILSASVPFGGVVGYTDDGWLLVVEELSLLGRPVAPPDVTPEELYEYAQIIYNNNNSLTEACGSLYDVVEEITDQLYPEITNNQSTNVFWGPTGLTFSVEGGIIDQIGIASYQWNLSGDDNSNAVSPSKVFRLPGTYQITATIILNDSTQYDLQHQIRVYPPNLEVGYPNGYGSLNRTFSTSSSPYITDYLWRIDQTSNVSHEQSFSYAFDEADYHTVTLSVTLDTGDIVNTTREIYLGDSEIHIRTSIIDWNEMWYGGRTYIIENSLYISSGATLTIEPGTTVKVQPGNYFSVYGTLVAEGVTFTSSSTTEPWGYSAVGGGFSFSGTSSSGSRLENCVIKNATGWDEYGAESVIRIMSSSPTIIGCTIQRGVIGTADTAIRKDKGDAIITNNTFSDFDTGILLKNDFNGIGGDPLVENNTFVNCSIGIRIKYSTNNLNQPVRVRNNHFSSCQLAGVAVSGSIDEAISWPNDGDYLVESSMYISSGATLTIEPGTTVKVQPGNYFSVYGTLVAEGAIFTWADGINEWDGIRFSGDADSASTLKDCTIEHAAGTGSSSPLGAIYIDDSSPTITGCTINNSTAVTGIRLYDTGQLITPTITNNTIGGFSSQGIYVDDDSSPTITGNTLINNQNGIYIPGNNTGTYQQNIFSGNSSYGLYYYGTTVINAANSNWGDPSGPYDPSDDRTDGGWYNPDGLGDKVSDHVEYQPWQVNDTDGDGLSDDAEDQYCTKFDDADTDDDGISDGAEDVNHNGIVDFGETDPCDIDTDDDGIQDGTESGTVTPVLDPDEDGPLHGTDTNIFQPDLDPLTTTDPLNFDTDGDTWSDGVEDVNHNGRVDSKERDPSKFQITVNFTTTPPTIDGEIGAEEWQSASEISLKSQQDTTCVFYLMHDTNYVYIAVTAVDDYTNTTPVDTFSTGTFDNIAIWFGKDGADVQAGETGYGYWLYGNSYLRTNEINWRDNQLSSFHSSAQGMASGPPSSPYMNYELKIPKQEILDTITGNAGKAGIHYWNDYDSGPSFWSPSDVSVYDVETYDEILFLTPVDNNKTSLEAIYLLLLN